MDAVQERAARLRNWSSDASFGWASVGARGLSSPRARITVRIAESLYPPEEAGQVILGRRVDAVYADEILGAELAAANLSEPAPEANTAHVWCSELMRPPARERLNLASGQTWAGKPVGALYTSPGSVDFPGAWFIYSVSQSMDLDGSSQWDLTAGNARVCVIDSAISWCRFAFTWIGVSGGIDWTAVSEEYDAVHVTSSAVAATDCFEFEWQGRVIPASFWGAETTVWLRWMFTEVATRGPLPPDEGTASGSIRASSL